MELITNKLRLKRRNFVVILVLLIGLIYFLLAEEQSAPTQFAANNQPGQYTVIEVDDGDTITVNSLGHTEKVRLIGIDTPEIHHPNKPIQCYAKEASEYLESLIGKATVRLEADPEDDNRDIYGRLLRYVYLPDGTLVNSLIVENGYGFAYTHFPFTKKELMINLENIAKSKNLGLWGKCTIIDGEYSKETNPIE